MAKAGSPAFTRKTMNGIRYTPAAVRRLTAAKLPIDKPGLEVIKLNDREAVYLSRADLTTGLLGFPSPTVDGYMPETAFGIVRNIVANPEFVISTAPSSINLLKKEDL
jgi:hypothetical protein